MIKLTNRRAFILGAIIGIGLIAVNLATDSLKILFTPWWQEIIFFPGFLAGGLFYRYLGRLLPAADEVAVIIGLLTVIASYGFIAIGLWRLFRWFNCFSMK